MPLKERRLSRCVYASELLGGPEAVSGWGGGQKPLLISSLLVNLAAKLYDGLSDGLIDLLDANALYPVVSASAIVRCF
jgi:hypothetical protein